MSGNKKTNVKRHHKFILKEAILGITNPALKRLAQRAGVKRIASIVPHELRGLIKMELGGVLRDAIILTEHHRRKTVGGDEVKEALSLRGINILYHEKKAKVVAKPKGEDTKSEVTKKKSHSHNNITLDNYIYRVLKQIHPLAGINAGAKSQLNQYLMVLLKRLNSVARNLSSFNEKKTLTSREVQSAVISTLPGMLSRHAVAIGTKAITKFNASQTVVPFVKPKKPSTIVRAAKAPLVGPVSTRAARAGLVFAPSRIENLMRGIKKLNSDFKIAMRIGSTAPVYMAAVLEYICAKILEFAGNAARDNNKVRITSRHIFLAIYTDQELEKLADDMGIIIANGGVIPNIHYALLPKKQREAFKEGILGESEVY